MKDTLKDKFLYFCAAESDEDYFNNSLIYLCANDENGSYGPVSYTHLTLPTKA